ncbi:MAG: hypothetical protein AB1657_00370 [Candidatus Micrarchaeota archaeon]
MKYVWMMTILLVAGCFANNLYLVIDPYNYSLEYATVLGGEPAVQNDSITGEYRIEVVEAGEIIFSQRFSAPMDIVFWDGMSGGGMEERVAPIRGYVPYASERQAVNLYAGDTRIAEYTFEFLCNRDSVCSGEEDYLSCPTDCAEEGNEVYTAVNVSELKPFTIPGLVEHPIDEVPELTPAEMVVGLVMGLLDYAWKFWPYICGASVVLLLAALAGYYFGRRRA